MDGRAGRGVKEIEKELVVLVRVELGKLGWVHVRSCKFPGKKALVRGGE